MLMWIRRWPPDPWTFVALAVLAFAYLAIGSVGAVVVFVAIVVWFLWTEIWSTRN